MQAPLYRCQVQYFLDSGDHVEYCLVVEHRSKLRWQVWRRFNDFVQVYEDISGGLSAEAAALLPTPPRKSWLPSFALTTHFLEERQRDLQAYLQAMVCRLDCVRHPAIQELLGVRLPDEPAGIRVVPRDQEYELEVRPGGDPNTSSSPIDEYCIEIKHLETHTVHPFNRDVGTAGCQPQRARIGRLTPGRHQFTVAALNTAGRSGSCTVMVDIAPKTDLPGGGGDPPGPSTASIDSGVVASVPTPAGRQQHRTTPSFASHQPSSVQGVLRQWENQHPSQQPDQPQQPQQQRQQKQLQQQRQQQQRTHDCYEQVSVRLQQQQLQQQQRQQRQQQLQHQQEQELQPQLQPHLQQHLQQRMQPASEQQLHPSSSSRINGLRSSGCVGIPPSALESIEPGSELSHSHRSVDSNSSGRVESTHSFARSGSREVERRRGHGGFSGCIMSPRSSTQGSAGQLGRRPPPSDVDAMPRTEASRPRITVPVSHQGRTSQSGHVHSPLHDHSRLGLGQAATLPASPVATCSETQASLTTAVSSSSTSGTAGSLGAATSACHESDDDDLYCVVCLTHAKTHAFVPCGHRCVCAGCSKEVLRGSGKAECPVCRTRANGALQIFT